MSAPETKATGGTSLEILAPYLIAKPPIELQLDYTDGHRIEYVELIGLAGSARIRFADGFTQWAGLERLTPVLKSFSALCDPLPDGTVPARVVCGLMGSTLWDADSLKVEGRSIILYRVGRSIAPRFHYDDIFGDRIPLNVADYLRRNHFAIPVNGRPLVEGIDYIPKTA